MVDNILKSSQIDRFKETARALGCDEDEATFKAKLAVIARQKPKAESGNPPATHNVEADT